MTFDLEIAAEMSQRIGDATKRSKGGKDANAMVARRGQRRAVSYTHLTLPKTP